VVFALPGLKTLKSGAVIARYAIPTDARDEYRRLYGKGREERWRAEPGAPEWGRRKQLYGEWVAEISKRIEAIRAAKRGESIDLSRKDAAALAGEWYNWFVARHDSSPGKPERWDTALWLFVDELQQFAPDEVRAEPMRDLEWTREPETRAGIKPVVAGLGLSAQFLATKGIRLTNQAEALFLDFVVDNYIAALSRLESLARNDYSPDETVASFPKFTGGPARPNDEAKSPWRLFEGWAAARQPAPSTIERWRSVFLDLEATFAGHEAQSLTADTAQAWSKAKITDDRSPKTVRDIWVNAAHTIYEWAKSERMIRSNPFADVSVTVPRRISNRESAAFTGNEAGTILRAATASTSDDAKRWVPWLCAYSGARAGEITQLRGIDIERRGDFHVMRITPDAGTTRTRMTRTVPLHEHVIAQGFLDFVSTRGSGPLFYESDPASTAPDDPMKPKRSRAALTRGRLASWVREIGITDPEVRPNHAWRHTFKQIAERNGISSRVHDVITGHSAKTTAEEYGKATVDDMAAVLKKFPRYEI
jgi:integrase